MQGSYSLFYFQITLASFPFIGNIGVAKEHTGLNSFSFYAKPVLKLVVCIGYSGKVAVIEYAKSKRYSHKLHILGCKPGIKRPVRGNVRHYRSIAEQIIIVAVGFSALIEGKIGKHIG